MPQDSIDDSHPPGRMAAPARTQPPARRHRLSVLFCDLCDSTALSAALEAEDYAELLTELRDAYEATVASHGGTVVRIQGDGMLAVFGHPQPREGDGRRAVQAALRLHEAVRALPVPASINRRFKLRLHSGVHAGLVLVQEGNLVIGRLELLGMVPNIASRLSAAAGRDEVLVSAETLGRDRALFKTGAARAVQAHGHERPVECWPIERRLDPGASPAVAVAGPAAPAFVGREPELARLESCLAEVLGGTTRQVAITGPAGLGKTRLAAEFLRRAERKGCRVLEVRCDDDPGAAPLSPWAQLLRRALGLASERRPAAPVDAHAAHAAHEALEALEALQGFGLQALAPALQPLLGAAAAEPAPPAIEPTLHAAAQVLVRCAQRQPLVVFLDDWHAADSASRQALATLVALAQAGERLAGLLVLSSNRSADAGDATMRQVEVLALAPFSPEDGAASIRNLLPSADPFVAKEIYRHSGGNALFIEELCHSARDRPVRLAGQQVGAAWLQVLIESRVARLPAELATLVRTLAVIGNSVPAWLLRAVTGLTLDDHAVHRLAHEDLLYPDSTTTLRFKHGLARDVIYESVGLHERRALHAEVAAALQAQAAGGNEDPHEGLAYHLGAAGHAAEAAVHAERGGDRAAALSALDRAKALYHAALVHLEASGLVDEGRGPSDAGEAADAVDARDARDAGDAGNDNAARARTMRWLQIANKLGLACVFDAARNDLPVFERAVRLAAAQPDPSLRARAEYWLGYILYALGQARDAVHHCERAAALAGDGSDPLAVQVRAALGQALAAASHYAAAEPLLAHAVEVKRAHRRGGKTPVGLAYSLVCLASVRGDRGEFGPAHALLDEAAALLQGATHEIGASIEGWRAVIHSWQGRWAEALAAAEASTAIAERTHSLFQFCQGRATGAYAAWMLHGDDRFIDRLAESTLWLAPRESGLFRSLDHGWLADGWFARGERVLAPEHAARALAPEHAARALAHEHAARALAREHAARALLRARAGDVIGVAMACRALARDAAQQCRPDRARHWLARAERIAAQRESRHEAAANQLCAAEIARAADDRAEARRAADAALSAFEPLQMTWHAERAQRLLAAL